MIGIYCHLRARFLLRVLFLPPRRLPVRRFFRLLQPAMDALGLFGEKRL
jgi:hypothetical protein